MHKKKEYESTYKYLFLMYKSFSIHFLSKKGRFSEIPKKDVRVLIDQIPFSVAKLFTDDLIRIRYLSSVTKLYSSFVYFISDGKFVKIGKSKFPSKRFYGIQSCNPNKLNMILCVDDEKENKIHNDLEKYNERGEWFRLEKEVYKYIEDIKSRKNKISNLRFDFYSSSTTDEKMKNIPNYTTEVNMIKAGYNYVTKK